MAIRCYICDGPIDVSDLENPKCTSKLPIDCSETGQDACLTMETTTESSYGTFNTRVMGGCAMKEYCSQTVHLACTNMQKMYNTTAIHTGERMQVTKCSGQCCTTDLCNKPPIGKATLGTGVSQQEVASFGAIFTAALSSILLSEWMLGNNWVHSGFPQLPQLKTDFFLILR